MQNRGQNRTREIRPSGIVEGLQETWPVGVFSTRRARLISISTRACGDLRGGRRVTGVPTATGPVVPANPPNNAPGGAAEAGEERGPAKGNATGKTRPGHRAGKSVPSELDRVRQVAKQDKDVRFSVSTKRNQEARCRRSD